MVALEICLPGFFDSAAAMVTISVPMKENMVVRMAPNTAPMPFGRKPWVSNRWETPLTWLPGRKPKIAMRPRTMKPMMANTLIRANQNSNSP
ncbi:hypothetical protein D3C87_1686230 [compost metagenome]